MSFAFSPASPVKRAKDVAGPHLVLASAVDHQGLHRREVQYLARAIDRSGRVSLDRRAQPLLDRLDLGQLARTGQHDRHARLAGTAGTTDAMRMDVGIVGDVVADHQRQRGDIQTARGDIGGDQDRAAAVGETHQHLVAVALLEVAMQGQRGEAATVQLGGQGLGILAHIAEHQGRRRMLRLEDLRQRIDLLRRLDLAHALLDGSFVMRRLDRHLDRIALHALADLADLFRIGGREQQGLVVLGDAPDDVVDRFLETHVEHPVGLVQDQHLHAATVQAVLLQVLLDAPGRTHDNMRVMA